MTEGKRLGDVRHPGLIGAGHGFRPGGADLDSQLVHGADCDDCHDFLRGMSADRCCEWHYARRYGIPGWTAYRARRAELLGSVSDNNVSRQHK